MRFGTTHAGRSSSEARPGSARGSMFPPDLGVQVLPGTEVGSLTLNTRALGSDRLWQHSDQRSVLVRGGRENSTRTCVVAQLEGTAVINSGARCVELMPGSVVFLSGALPASMETQAARQVGLELASAWSCSSSSRVSGIALPPAHPIGDLLVQSLKTLWNATDAVHLERGFGPEAAASAVVALSRWALADLVKPKSGLELLCDRARDAMIRRVSDETASAASIASSLRVSRRHLDRATVATTGFTAQGLLNELRLQRAREWLLNGQTDPRGVGLIGLECGFSSASHFARRFRRRFGVAPSEVARAGRAPNSAG
jgi:AraC-like DNA-binding protein